MQRLTIRNSDGSVSQPMGLDWAKALEKLAAYEDTGLTPEDIKPGINAAARKRLACEYFGLSASQVSRIEDLAQADKDGRLVVLPCKIDHPIYLIRTEKEPRKGEKDIVEEYDIDHFTIGGAMIPMITACSKENEWKALIDGTQRGYEYFLDREEAEKALEGVASHGTK